MTSTKEANARIKINKLLEEAGWRLLESPEGPANVELETNIKITKKEIDSWGEDFETTENGFVDFLLLDENRFPLVVLEAKSETKNPMDGKEQARRYANSQNARFVLLSNGNTHFFWDLERGNPEIITSFPTQESLKNREDLKFNPENLASVEVDENYIALTQKPDFKDDPRYKDEPQRQDYIARENLRILRPYQLKAVRALQKSAKAGNDRFLFEMATGTGKTLLSAAIIKLFLRTGNAKRILFLVDRLVLEDQAHKTFERYLSKDYTSVIYKQNRDDWKKAEIVVSTIQSLASQDKYKKLFSPTDFELIISDEAHRSLGQNSRAVFQYFLGFKLGLTATPKDYLKNIDAESLSEKDPRELERRMLLDTYTTFGCKTGEPTFRYSLTDGVKDGYLINPITVDARTDITTKLLSDEGYAVVSENEDGEKVEESFFLKDFEKKFFSKETNQVFCEAIINNALTDPLSGEMGKTIVFCVSQKHASKITQILNQIADQKWPSKYNSDFAVQVTYNIPDAQQMPVNFTNNNLNGRTKFWEGYKSSKTRVCVTVAMMTTGYDCQDILNLALLRPIFSPTDFVQMKGRGTRTFTFEHTDENKQKHTAPKQSFKLFDFFANCEYFENEFKYDEALELLKEKGSGGSDENGGGEPSVKLKDYEFLGPDEIRQLIERPVGDEGMKIDRKLFENVKAELEQDAEIATAVDEDNWDRAVQVVIDKYEDKPELFMTLERLRKSEELDRRLTWREVLERIFGRIDRFKSREEKLEDEYQKFISIHNPPAKELPHIRSYIKAYISDPHLRDMIKNGHFQELDHYSAFRLKEYKAMGEEWRKAVPEYVMDYVSLNPYEVS